jgi:hypothetical protein
MKPDEPNTEQRRQFALIQIEVAKVVYPTLIKQNLESFLKNPDYLLSKKELAGEALKYADELITQAAENVGIDKFDL